MSALLTARGLAVGYGGVRVASGITFEVSKGTLWALLGPNGAGKSTLLRTALGWLPPLEGDVLLFGRSAARWERPLLSRRVAWVPQTFEADAGFTGLELVLMGRSPHLGAWGVPSERDVALARAALEELGIAHLARRRAGELSGGEKRLLLLARALAQSPELLLLDEPTAFLDLRHQVQVLQRVRARVDAGLAAVAVLHDANLAASVADHVLLLREGGVLGLGPAAQWLSAEKLAALYGLPMVEAVAPDGARAFAPRWTP
ncbi:MAG: ABC transporter ATP-binding protein [Myxococcaceae bacterium]